ncbi:hypothetical protein HY230_07485 [Candidatus Acetothermia bacterium]|nr:hypothetical protein [Candidatus Acetothermia bacterium]
MNCSRLKIFSALIGVAVCLTLVTAVAAAQTFQYMPELQTPEVTIKGTRLEISRVQLDLRELRSKIFGLDKTLFSLFRSMSSAADGIGRVQTPNLATSLAGIRDNISMLASQTPGTTLRAIEDFKTRIEDKLKDQNNSDRVDSISESIRALLENGIINSTTESALASLIGSALDQLHQINLTLGGVRNILLGDSCKANKDARDFIVDAIAALDTEILTDERAALREAKLCTVRAVRAKNAIFTMIRMTDRLMARISQELRVIQSPSQTAPLVKHFSVQSVKLLPDALVSGHFTVRVIGTGIAAIEVTIYDLTGDNLVNARSAGARLSFSLGSAQSAWANGVYLYVVTVLGHDGESVRSEMNKFFVLR